MEHKDNDTSLLQAATSNTFPRMSLPLSSSNGVRGESIIAWIAKTVC